MTLMSMTGFARTTFEHAGTKYVWELKTVNARGLDLRLRIPSGLEQVEVDIRQLVRDRIARGTCFASLQEEGGTGTDDLVLNERALTLVVAAARRLAEVDGIAPPCADGLLALPGVLQSGARGVDREMAEGRGKAILAALETALAELKVARREEGSRIHQVLSGQVAQIEELVSAASILAEEALPSLRARIAEQVDLLVSDRKQLDPDRLHQEAVLVATRADVREELDRLRGHVEAARTQLASPEPVGRRLEFLAQEFNREANTLCSKAFDRRLGEIGIELKTVIDQWREQVQNVE